MDLGTVVACASHTVSRHTVSLQRTLTRITNPWVDLRQRNEIDSVLGTHMSASFRATHFTTCDEISLHRHLLGLCVRSIPFVRDLKNQHPFEAHNFARRKPSPIRGGTRFKTNNQMRDWSSPGSKTLEQFRELPGLCDPVHGKGTLPAPYRHPHPKASS